MKSVRQAPVTLTLTLSLWVICWCFGGSNGWIGGVTAAVAPQPPRPTMQIFAAPIPNDRQPPRISTPLIHHATCGQTEDAPCPLPLALRIALPHSTIVLLPGTYTGSYRVTFPVRIVAQKPHTAIFDGKMKRRPLTFDNTPANVEGVHVINGWGETAGCMLITQSRPRVREMNKLKDILFSSCASFTHEDSPHDVSAGALAVVYKYYEARLIEADHLTFENNYARGRNAGVSAGGLVTRWGTRFSPFEAHRLGKQVSADALQPFAEARAAGTDRRSSLGATTARGDDAVAECQVFGASDSDRARTVHSFLSMNRWKRFQDWTVNGFPVYSTRTSIPLAPSAISDWLSVCPLTNRWTVCATQGEILSPDNIPSCSGEAFVQTNGANERYVDPLAPARPLEEGAFWHQPGQIEPEMEDEQFLTIGDHEYPGPSRFTCDDWTKNCKTFVLRRLLRGSKSQLEALKVLSGMYTVERERYASRSQFRHATDGKLYVVWCPEDQRWVFGRLDEAPGLNTIGSAVCQARFLRSSRSTSSNHPMHEHNWDVWDGQVWQSDTQSVLDFNCIPPNVHAPTTGAASTSKTAGTVRGTTASDHEAYCRVIALRGGSFGLPRRHVVRERTTKPFLLMNQRYLQRPVYREAQAEEPFFVWYCGGVEEWIVSQSDPFEMTVEQCTRGLTSAHSFSHVPYGPMLWLYLSDFAEDADSPWAVHPDVSITCTEDSASFLLDIPGLKEGLGRYSTIGIVNGSRVFRRDEAPSNVILYYPAYNQWRIMSPKDVPSIVRTLMEQADKGDAVPEVHQIAPPTSPLEATLLASLPSGRRREDALDYNVVQEGMKRFGEEIVGYDTRPIVLGSCSKGTLVHCSESPLAVDSWEVQKYDRNRRVIAPKKHDKDDHAERNPDFSMVPNPAYSSPCLAIKVFFSRAKSLKGIYMRHPNMLRSDRPVFEQQDVPRSLKKNYLYYCHMLRRWVFGHHNPDQWTSPHPGMCEHAGVASQVTAATSPTDVSFEYYFDASEDVNRWLWVDANDTQMSCISFEDEVIHKSWSLAKAKTSFEYLPVSSSTLFNLTFRNNNGYGDNGRTTAGAVAFVAAQVALGSTHQFQLKNSVFHRNVAHTVGPIAGGGGQRPEGESLTHSSNPRLIATSAGAVTFYAAVAGRGPTADLSNVTLSANKGSAGGAVFSGLAASVKRSNFERNVGARVGGAIHMQFNTNLSISRSRCTRNVGIRGGCLSSDTTSLATLRRTDFTENKATVHDGDDIYGGWIEFFDTNFRTPQLSMVRVDWSDSLRNAASSVGLLWLLRKGRGSFAANMTHQKLIPLTDLAPDGSPLPPPTLNAQQHTAEKGDSEWQKLDQSATFKAPPLSYFIPPIDIFAELPPFSPISISSYIVRIRYAYYYALYRLGYGTQEYEMVLMLLIFLTLAKTLYDLNVYCQAVRGRRDNQPRRLKLPTRK